MTWFVEPPSAPIYSRNRQRTTTARFNSCDRFVFCGEKSGFAGRKLSYVSTRLRPDCRCVDKLKAAECLPAVVLGGQQMLRICIIAGTEHVNLSGLLTGTSNANWLGSRQQTEQLFKNDLA